MNFTHNISIGNAVSHSIGCRGDLHHSIGKLVQVRWGNVIGDIHKQEDLINYIASILIDYPTFEEFKADLNKKVDKIDGYGLSKNDFSDVLKALYDDAVVKAHIHENKAFLDSLTSLKTVNGESIIGDGDIEILNKCYTLSFTKDNPKKVVVDMTKEDAEKLIDSNVKTFLLNYGANAFVIGGFFKDATKLGVIYQYYGNFITNNTSYWDLTYNEDAKRYEALYSSSRDMQFPTVEFINRSGYVKGRELKTINGENIVGEGDIKVKADSPIIKADVIDSYTEDGGLTILPRLNIVGETNVEATARFRDVVIGEKNGNQRSLTVNGTSRLNGEVHLNGNSIDGVGDMIVDGKITTDSFKSNDIINDNKIETNSLYVWGGTNMRSSLDMNNNDINNVQSITVSGTSRLNGDTKTKGVAPNEDKKSNLGKVNARYKTLYVTKINGGGDDVKFEDKITLKDGRKLDDILTPNTPNIIKFGDLDITDGQMSNFSSTNYAQFPFLVDLTDKVFTIVMQITTSADVTTQQNILDSQDGLAFAVRNGQLVLAVSNNGVSWAFEAVGGTILPNTTYYIRLGWDKAIYKVLYSTDNGATWVEAISKNSTLSPYPKTMLIGKDTTDRYIFKGSINLNKCTLAINGQYVWDGMTDAGLLTRLDTSLSNIDSDGIEKVKEIASITDYNELEHKPLTWKTAETSEGNIPYIALNNDEAAGIDFFSSYMVSFSDDEKTLADYFNDTNEKLEEKAEKSDLPFDSADAISIVQKTPNGLYNYAKNGSNIALGVGSCINTDRGLSFGSGTNAIYLSGSNKTYKVNYLGGNSTWQKLKPYISGSSFVNVRLYVKETNELAATILTAYKDDNGDIIITTDVDLGTLTSGAYWIGSNTFGRSVNFGVNNFIGGNQTFINGMMNFNENGNYSSVFGAFNTNNSNYSNVFGAYNNNTNVYGTVLGYGNTNKTNGGVLIGLGNESNDTEHNNGNFIIGNTNKTNGYVNTLLGLSNYNKGKGDKVVLIGANNINEDANNSFVLGSDNQVTHSNVNVPTSIVGTLNIANNSGYILGYGNTLDSRAGTLVGYGLKTNTQNLNVAIGSYNAPSDDTIFTVGIGQSDTARKNGLAINTDGTVLGKDGKEIAYKEDVEEKVDNSKMLYTITEDMFDLEYDATKGVAPYNTSYGYTNITIHEDADIQWKEGAIYQFILDTKVSTSTYRNVRVRIGESGDWKPIMVTSAIAAGSTVFVKAINCIFIYKSVYQANGALHSLYDTNTTYTINYSIDGGRFKAGGSDAQSVSRYSLIMMKNDGTWEKLTDTTKAYSQATTKTVNKNGFILGQIRFYNYTTVIKGGDFLGGNYVYNKSASIDVSYSFNCGTAPNWAIGDWIYLVGTVGDDGLFYLDETQWWSNALPTENDGKVYIRLGIALTTTNATMSLHDDRPIFYHDGNNVRLYKL